MELRREDKEALIKLIDTPKLKKNREVLEEKIRRIEREHKSATEALSVTVAELARREAKRKAIEVGAR